MKFTTLSRRTAAVGAASALAAGALVGLTATGAQSAPIQNTYTCTNAFFPTFSIGLDSDAPTLDPIAQVSAGQAVPGGLLGVINTFTVSQAVRDGLAGNGIEDLTFPDFAGSFGGVAIPVEGVTAQVSEMTDNGDGSWSVDATEGSNGAFETPRAGTYDVLAPDAFTIVANGTINVACTLADAEPGSYKTLPVMKNDSSVTGKGPRKNPSKGDVAKIVAKVAAINETPGGKVILKKGAKTLDKATLNAKGKAVLATKALKVGNNKLTVVYKGDGYTTRGKSEPFVVKVTR